MATRVSVPGEKKAQGSLKSLSPCLWTLFSLSNSILCSVPRRERVLGFFFSSSSSSCLQSVSEDQKRPKKDSSSLFHLPPPCIVSFPPGISRSYSQCRCSLSFLCFNQLCFFYPFSFLFRRFPLFRLILWKSRRDTETTDWVLRIFAPPCIFQGAKATTSESRISSCLSPSLLYCTDHLKQWALFN